MGVKSLMAIAWDSGKEVVTKAAGALKSMATAVDDAWKNKAQPWIKEKLGSENMDRLASTEVISEELSSEVSRSSE